MPPIESLFRSVDFVAALEAKRSEISQAVHRNMIERKRLDSDQRALSQAYDQFDGLLRVIAAARGVAPILEQHADPREPAFRMPDPIPLPTITEVYPQII